MTPAHDGPGSPRHHDALDQPPATCEPLALLGTPDPDVIMRRLPLFLLALLLTLCLVPHALPRFGGAVVLLTFAPLALAVFGPHVPHHRWPSVHAVALGFLVLFVWGQ
ncbi:hypothetical protein [Nocardioides sp. Leaf285]|uniref:hypothetical protein n=1 Tax=Nocardioides sp. Leaf285 TaxID=1736322 RepID=UPI0007037C5D|nr:hypothetical protein [Nocardioides sp. Leaf285]KQP63005.1 hypothetical protein ASF47_18510 [Nocardioides sp. Leaf285]